MDLVHIFMDLVHAGIHVSYFSLFTTFAACTVTLNISNEGLLVMVFLIIMKK